MYTIFSDTFTLFDFSLCLILIIKYKFFFLKNYSSNYYLFITFILASIMYGYISNNFDNSVLSKSLRLFTYFFIVHKIFSFSTNNQYLIFKYFELFCTILILFTFVQFTAMLLFNLYIPGYIDNSIFPHIRTDIGAHADTYSHMFDNSFRLRSLLSEPSEIALALCPYIFTLIFIKKNLKFKFLKITIASIAVCISLSFTGIASLVIFILFLLFRSSNIYFKILSLMICIVPLYFIYLYFGDSFLNRADQRFLFDFVYLTNYYHYFIGLGVVGREFIGDWTPSLHRLIVYYGIGGTVFLFISYITCIRFINLTKFLYLLYILILICFTQLCVSYWVVYTSIPLVLLGNYSIIKNAAKKSSLDYT